MNHNLFLERCQKLMVASRFWSRFYNVCDWIITLSLFSIPLYFLIKIFKTHHLTYTINKTDLTLLLCVHMLLIVLNTIAGFANKRTSYRNISHECYKLINIQASEHAYEMIEIKYNKLHNKYEKLSMIEIIFLHFS